MASEKADIKFEEKQFSRDQLTHLYKSLLRPRIIEEKMLVNFRQGKISKWFSGIGQEAISVGVVEALAKDEYILPVHRNLGVFTSRNIPLEKLLAQWQGLQGGFTQGRDRSFHFGTHDHHIIGMISHLGAQLPVATGIALAHKLNNEPKVVVAFTGEGGTSEGDFHEALNLAAVWQLPVIFIVENNGYALSTPVKEQFHCKDLTDKAIGYGVEGIAIDGNDFFQVYQTVNEKAQKIRVNPEPLLLVANTFRRRGHEEASGTDYVPAELIRHWEAKDPLIIFENWLKEKADFSEAKMKEIRQNLEKEISSVLDGAYVLENITPDARQEIKDVYKNFHSTNEEINVTKGTPEKRFVDALNEGLHQGMAKYPNLVLMGQDIAEYGGVFKITANLAKEYGKERVRNTPLCESAVLGASLGLAIKGMKSVVEMQFADFISCGFNQVVNNLAKSHYRWGQPADVVIRMPTGGSNGAGPFHSQSTEAWFFHTPGLKILYPANAFDAKGCLLAAMEDPNPVLFFEHKALYRTDRCAVPDAYYTVPLGQARQIREGSELCIITYGLGVKWSQQAVGELKVDAEIVDLVTLMPWDKEKVTRSVEKTNKVLVLHEDCITGGIGAEIAAWINENCFEWLDAPVMREGSLDTPVPFNKALEDNFLPVNRLKEKINTLWKY